MKQNNQDLQNRLKTSDRAHKLNSKVFTGSVQKDVHPLLYDQSSDWNHSCRHEQDWKATSMLYGKKRKMIFFRSSKNNLDIRKP